MQTIKHKNIYFGNDSVCKINLNSGEFNKVDTLDDFLAVMYAVYLDGIINGNMLLTHYEYADGSPLVIPFNPKSFNGRVKVLHILLSKLNLKNEDLFRQFLKEITSMMYKDKRTAYEMLRAFAFETNSYDLFSYIKSIIEGVKSRPLFWLK